MDSPVINSDAVIPIAAEEIVHLPPPPAIEGNWGGIPIVVEAVPSSTSATARNSIDQQRLRELRAQQYTHLDLAPPGSPMMRYTEPVIGAEENNNITPFIETNSEIKKTSYRVSPSSAFHDNERGMDELQHWNDPSPVEFTRTETTTTIAREAENTHLSMASFRAILQNENFEDDTRLVIGRDNTIERRPAYENETAAERDYSVLVNSFVRALGSNKNHFSAEQAAEARANGLALGVIREVVNRIDGSAVDDNSLIQHNHALLSLASSPAVSYVESEIDDNYNKAILKTNSTPQDPREIAISHIERRFNFIIDETNRRITQLPYTLYASAWAAAYPELRELTEQARHHIESMPDTDVFEARRRITALSIQVASVASKASIIANPEASKNAELVSEEIDAEIFSLFSPSSKASSIRSNWLFDYLEKALAAADNAMKSINNDKEFNRLKEFSRLAAITATTNRISLQHDEEENEKPSSYLGPAFDIVTSWSSISTPSPNAYAPESFILDENINSDDQQDDDSDMSSDSWIDRIGK